jgi:hypothetical protein
MLAAKRERLAGRSARYNLDVAKRRIVECASVAFMNRPMINSRNSLTLIDPKRLARVVVPFENRSMIEAGIPHPDGQSSRARE